MNPTAPLSGNTQAILLLTGHLLTTKGKAVVKPLSLSEYNRFAARLLAAGYYPRDLIGDDATQILEAVAAPADRDRISSLLARSFLLAQTLQQWQTRGIWVLSRADKTYPHRLKTRLKAAAPPIIYGCGEIDLLDGGGLAVVGSRNTSTETLDFTTAIGEACAKTRHQVVSGAAKGIDQAAMRGALNAGGAVIGVMADSLAKAVTAGDNRRAIADGRLCLVSAVDPSAGFNVGNAMGRNKYIYALADAALVVNATANKGGTWEGAIEQLDKLKLVTVYVRKHHGADAGNEALLKRGASEWPGANRLDEVLGGRYAAGEPALNPTAVAEPKPSNLELKLFEEQQAPSAAPSADHDIANRFATAINDALVELTREPKSEAEVVEILNVQKGQAKTWLAALVKEKRVRKVPKSKPVRFEAIG